MGHPLHAETDRAPTKAVAGDRCNPVGPILSQQHWRPETAFEKPDPAPGPEPRLVKKKASHLDWDTVAIWLFLIGLAVVSLIAGYQLWGKFSIR